MTVSIIRGDAAHLPLPDKSVDLIVTSPPYFALRSYQDGGEHYDGQIGSEPTPGEFVDALIACTQEWMRVLKQSGSMWVNLGDKYNKTKSLMGLPWRYALRCIDQLGLILRAEVVWSKPNGLPESVTDRVRRSHEQWFHLVKQPRYYSAIDSIREPHETIVTATGAVRYRNQGEQWEPRVKTKTDAAKTNDDRKDAGAIVGSALHPLGKLPGSVWSIPSQPLKAPAVSPLDGRPLPDHFAAFPMEWPRRLILGWSPSGICTRCGEGRRPVSVSSFAPTQRTNGSEKAGRNSDNNHDVTLRPFGRAQRETTVTGECCACPDTTAPTRPSVILDPFGGTGTTALVADVLGRHGISVDMSHDYSRLAQWRTSDPKQRQRAARAWRPAGKPAPKTLPSRASLPDTPLLPDGQMPMWDGDAA